MGTGPPGMVIGTGFGTQGIFGAGGQGPPTTILDTVCVASTTKVDTVDAAVVAKVETAVTTDAAIGKAIGRTLISIERIIFFMAELYLFKFFHFW
jgi:hypothetical protein